MSRLCQQVLLQARRSSAYYQLLPGSRHGCFCQQASTSAILTNYASGVRRASTSVGCRAEFSSRRSIHDTADTPEKKHTDRKPTASVAKHDGDGSNRQTNNAIFRENEGPNVTTRNDVEPVQSSQFDIDQDSSSSHHDYSYFQSLVSGDSAGAPDPEAARLEESLATAPQVHTAIDVQDDNDQVPKNEDQNLEEAGLQAIPHDASIYEQLDAVDVKPALPSKSYNLAPYVNESVTLTNLVKLGVNLSKVEKDREAANFLLKADFSRDVKPHLLFLHRVGVPVAALGTYLTRNPQLLQESLDNLQVRLNYLEAKKFDAEAIARVVTKAPLLLSRTTKQIDTQLGYLQKEFKLTGSDVRVAVTRLPKLITWNRSHIHEVRFCMKEFLGFSDQEQRELLLAQPKLYLCDKHALMNRFDYVHNTVGLSHRDIINWPDILRTRVHIVKARHGFLQHLGRDQYDPQSENYVSPKALVSGRDAEFCSTVAKVPVAQFNEFMKTV